MPSRHTLIECGEQDEVLTLECPACGRTILIDMTGVEPIRIVDPGDEFARHSYGSAGASIESTKI